MAKQENNKKADNYLDYMTDYIHFNDAGRELLAQRFVDCILPVEEAEE